VRSNNAEVVPHVVAYSAAAMSAARRSQERLSCIAINRTTGRCLIKL